MVDSNFFDIFSFRLLKGNPQTALTDPASVVLSEQTAMRYFGDKDPIGQTIELIGENQTQLFKVTGVVAEPPANSSIYYKVLFPFHTTGLSGPFARAAQSPKRNLNLLFLLT
jgi:putative ABC transport system permease protein